ncbi:MAG: YCF48-related protein [Acidobacteriota bacterium]
MRKLLILLIVAAVATPGFAQWRRASLSGADTRALIADPRDPDTLYLGTSGGEIYVSHDAAKTWANPRTGVPFPGYVVDNLLVDRAGRLWAACWGLWGGGVVAVSDDGGRSWIRRDAGLEDFSVRAIAIDTHDENFVVAGGLSGVYRSTNAGQTWDKISEQENVESLALDPRDHSRIFVGTWRQGIRTDDGGKSWKSINNGMVLDTDMFAITIEPDDPDSVWVSTCGWVYNSPNSGDNWTRYRDGFNNRRVHTIEVDPCDKSSLYAGSVAGLYRSEDRGKSWYAVSDEGYVINDIVLHPQRPGRIILGTEGDGVYVSNDNARTFTRSCEGLHNLRITSVAADPSAKNRVYASVVFGGAATGLYESNDAGANWQKISSATLPEVLSLTIADEGSAGPKFLAGTEKGFFWSNDGREWTQSAPSSFPIRVEKVLRFNHTRAFAATSEGVFTSRDSGLTWYRLAGADIRAVDIAVGTIGERRALFALTANGLALFDGEKWTPIEGAPTSGHTMAVRSLAGSQFVFIAGAAGVKAGRIDLDRKWHDADAPDAQHASVFAGTGTSEQTLFLTSRSQREILIGQPAEPDWLSLSLPSRTAEVSSIAPDPFDPKRFYVGTLGEGVYVYEGATQKYVHAKHEAEAASLGTK